MEGEKKPNESFPANHQRLSFLCTSTKIYWKTGSFTIRKMYQLLKKKIHAVKGIFKLFDPKLTEFGVKQILRRVEAKTLCEVLI